MTHFDIVGGPHVENKPKIVMGYERLRPGPASVGPVGAGWIICNDHGTSKGVLVKMGMTIAWCCRLCISQHCRITDAEFVGPPQEAPISWGE